MIKADTQRLFFALWPDDKLRRALVAARQRLPSIAGRPVDVSNWHITLCFIGGVDPARRQCLESEADNIQGIGSFDLILDCAGYWRKPRVFWLGSTAIPEPLGALVNRLRDGMSRCGIEPESRPFATHLTLLRKVNHAPAHCAIEPLAWTARDFVLVASNTRPEGVEYSVLRRWPLRSGEGSDVAEPATR